MVMVYKTKSGSASLKDVAARAGVSIATVSNVVNGNKKFSIKTQELVEKAISDLNYVPDKAASSLRLAKQWTISYLIRDTTNEFLSDPVCAGIAAGLSETLNQHGYDLQIKLCADRQIRLNDVFRRRSTDALIMTSSGGPSELKQAFDTVQQLGVPVVLVKHRSTKALNDFAFVDQDEDEGGRMIADHLLERGARTFWFVTTKTSWHAFGRRFMALKKASSKFGDACEIHLIKADSERYDSAKAAVQLYAEQHKPPDAIVGGNDSLAIAAMHAMQDRGITPSKDVLICGFNGLDVASYARPRLTTIVGPVKDMGREAGRLALARLETGAFPVQSTILPVSLRHGFST